MPIESEQGTAAALVRASMPSPPPPTPVSGSAPTAASGEPDREASGVGPTSSSIAGAQPAEGSPPSRPEPSTSSRRLGLAAVLLVIIAAGVGIWVNRADRPRAAEPAPLVEEAPPPPADRSPDTTPEASDTPSAATSPDETEAAEPAVAKPETAEPEAAEPEAAKPEAAEPVEQAPKPGRLSVAVFPWGDVWIDGKARGRAPLRGVALPPGRHKVSAGQGEPSKTKVVRLKEGQRLRVQFDLSEQGDTLPPQNTADYSCLQPIPRKPMDSRVRLGVA